jgi:hypothetical protein
MFEGTPHRAAIEIRDCLEGDARMQGSSIQDKSRSTLTKAGRGMYTVKPCTKGEVLVDEKPLLCLNANGPNTNQELNSSTNSSTNSDRLMDDAVRALYRLFKLLSEQGGGEVGVVGNGCSNYDGGGGGGDGGGAGGASQACACEKPHKRLLRALDLMAIPAGE